MSSYHSYFKYLDKSSKDDFGWIIAAFDPDNGEVDGYLSQDQVYTDSYNGARRILYGTRWNAVTIVKITVVKYNGAAFTLDECRRAYRWLTGNPQASWLDLYVDDLLKYSLLCTIQDVKPQKIDARTVGLNIYCESVSPWAYSPQQVINYSFDQRLSASSSGVVYGNDSSSFNIDANGVVYNNVASDQFVVDQNGIIYLENSVNRTLDIPSDDLYSYINLETTFKNINSDYLSIKNLTLGEETIITDMSPNEVITLSAEQFIVSDIPNKIFGNTFNFVWPKLVPGINKIVIYGSGQGSIEFVYRYPIKIGDCAMDVNVSGVNSICGDCPDISISNTVSWNNITDTPTTIDGYGIGDAYTIPEVDSKTSINESELNDILGSTLK